MAAPSDTEKLNRELSILNTVAQALNREVDLSKALHTALAHVAELLGLRTGWVWLLREESGEAYLAAAQNLPPALTESPHVRTWESGQEKEGGDGVTVAKMRDS